MEIIHFKTTFNLLCDRIIFKFSMLFTAVCGLWDTQLHIGKGAAVCNKPILTLCCDRDLCLVSPGPFHVPRR